MAFTLPFCITTCVLLSFDLTVFAFVAESPEHHSPIKDILGSHNQHGIDHIPREEQLKRLSKIVDRIDSDHDGKITALELKEWMHTVGQRYFHESADRVWADHKLTSSQGLSWDAYKESFMADLEAVDNEDQEAYGKRMLELESKKFQLADVDKDGKLSLHEFAVMEHPEDHPEMRKLEAEVSMFEMDKDKDGFVSLEEYLADMGVQGTEAAELHEPQFKTYDKDADGKLNLDELSLWLLPRSIDRHDEEIQHLIEESDDNKDKILTKEEILAHMDAFIGSHVTDFGEELRRIHDEL